MRYFSRNSSSDIPPMRISIPQSCESIFVQVNRCSSERFTNQFLAGERFHGSALSLLSLEVLATYLTYLPYPPGGYTQAAKKGPSFTVQQKSKTVCATTPRLLYVGSRRRQRGPARRARRSRRPRSASATAPAPACCRRSSPTSGAAPVRACVIMTERRWPTRVQPSPPRLLPVYAVP